MHKKLLKKKLSQVVPVAKLNSTFAVNDMLHRSLGRAVWSRVAAKRAGVKNDQHLRMGPVVGFESGESGMLPEKSPRVIPDSIAGEFVASASLLAIFGKISPNICSFCSFVAFRYYEITSVCSFSLAIVWKIASEKLHFT